MAMTQKDIDTLIEKVKAGTYTIEDALKEIADSAKGKDVRKALYALGYTLNQEGKAGSVDLLAREELQSKASKAELNTEISERKQEIAVERARIDQFTSLAEGSTTGDAELADLRVGADGKTYPNAGDAVRGQIGELKSDLNYIATIDKYDDLLGTNASVTAQYNTDGFVWDSGTKTLSVSIENIASNTMGWAVMLPKLINAHDYVLAVEFSMVGRTADAYTYIRNLTYPYNYNNGQRIAEAVIMRIGDKAVYKFTAESDGWLAIGFALIAGYTYSDAFTMALYDVTDSDVDGFSDDEWLQFLDSVYAISGGILPSIISKNDYSYNLVSKVKGEKWSALGDSLTASGSGGQYLDYVKNTLGLTSYKNCGIGGTMISGAESDSAMYQDARIETLDIDSKCVTIMGGTNDVWQSYYNEHPSTNMSGWGEVTRENHDVSTFVGAYNVMLSKILYKFCKVPAYYNDVDYSGITQVTTPINNFRLILLTPPQRFYVSDSSMSENITNNGIKNAHSYVKQIAEMWGLPCVDTWEMGMNDISKPLFFANYLTDSTHFNSFGHERLASLLIDKVIQVSRYK